MVEEDVHGLCKLLTQALTSCAVSRGFWIATTHEAITQPSLSEMFIQLQFSSLGPEEFGSVVRGVNPKKSCCTFYWQTLFLWPPRPCLQSSWAWFHHSQIGNVIKAPFEYLPFQKTSVSDLERQIAKLLFPFLFIYIQPLFPIFPSTQKQNKVYYFSD